MTAPLLVPVPIALLWAAVSGSFAPLNLGFGLLLGLAALGLVRESRSPVRVSVRPLPLIGLAGLFIYELVKSGIRVLVLALSPRLSLHPAIVAVPLGFLGARNVVTSVLWRFSLRRLLDGFRGVDQLIWALAYVRAVGLGPLAGVLAIFTADIAVLAKLYAEAIENAEKKQADAR